MVDCPLEKKTPYTNPGNQNAYYFTIIYWLVALTIFKNSQWEGLSHIL